MINNNNPSSDDETCSTLSFRNDDMIVEFMLQEEQEGSAVKIDTYSSGDDEKRSEIPLEGEEEWSDKECRYLAQMNDPRFMTARQRSLLDKRSGGGGIREINTTEEMNNPIGQHQQLRSQTTATVRQTDDGKAYEHRRAVKERQQEEQRVTVEKLLKVTPGGGSRGINNNNKRTSRHENNNKSCPSIRIVSSQRPGCTSYVAFTDPDLCPVWSRDNKSLPVIIRRCSAVGCTNKRRYCCARTGRPLCHRMECYRSISGVAGSSS